MIEVETPQEIEVVTNGVEVEASTLDVEVVDLSELDITVAKREFVITGDDIYIPKLYDDAPQWMKDLVDIVVNNAMETGNAATLNEMASMLSQFAVSYVPLNQYTQSILDLSNEDARINLVIETLNSYFNDGLSEANAQIINVQNTKASKDEVIAQVITTLSAQLANPTSELGATIGRIDQTIVDNQNANALSMQVLTSTLEGLGEDVSGNSTALQTLSTYVGIEKGVPTGTGLLADVAILQKQNDGVIETYTGTYDVMVNPQNPELAELVVTAEPYASWKAADVTGINTRLAHIGDVYIKYNVTDNGAKEYLGSYKFIRAEVDSIDAHKSTDSDGFTWALIVDQAAQDAYTQALNAYDLADDKRRVFTTTPYGPYNVGDLWIKEETVGTSLQRAIADRLSGYLASEWSIAGDSGVLNLQTVVNNVQAQVDSKVDTYYQDTMPFTNATNVAKKVQAGDYWYCTLTNGSYVKGKIYKYVESPNGSNYNYTWTENADVSKYVFDIADGKASIFTTASQPSAYKINDMMIVTTASFNNGTTTFSTGVVLTAGATRTSGFVPGDWTKKINDTEELDAFVNTVYTPAIAGLQTQVDGQVSYYFYDSALGQTAASVSGSASWTTDTLKRDHNGDIAYDTTLKVGYWYDRTTANWVQITGAQNAGVIEALKRAAAAKEAADNVIVSYYAWKQTTAPATQYKWMKDDNTLWEYVGSAWVAVDVKKDDTLTAYDNTTKDTTLYVHNGSNWAMITPNGLVANAKAVTDLNASLTSMGTTVSGHTSLLNTVDARIGTEGARVESKFAYNSSLMINGVPYNSGFGLSNSAGTGAGSEFWIDASRLKFTNSAKTGRTAPFTIDASGPTPQITFNGKVTFGSGQTGTIDEAIAAVVETVAVGDKNINITDNLIPITSLVADTDNSGYQFIGTPTKSNSMGIDTYAEAQIVLDGTDEVYSPYVDDLSVSYYYRFGVKGITSGSVFKIVTINSSNVPTSNTVTITMNSGQSIVATNWYIIEGIINPTGGSTAAVGSIRNSTGSKIGTVSSFVVPSGTSKLVLGWVANCTISRIKLCKVTADTVTSDLTTVNGQLSTLQTSIDVANANALARTLPSEVASAINNNTTTINGSKITTGSMSAKTIYTSDAFVGHTLQSTDYDGINGFILKSNAAGTSTDPTIYGAYIKGSTLEGSSIKLREVTVLTDSNHETKAIIGASSILSGSTWTYAIYPYNSTASTRNRLAKSSNNTIVFAGNTVNSNVSSYVSYRGWISLAVSTGGVQSGSYPYSYNNVLTVTIDGTSRTFSADTQISPYTFPCGLTLVTVFTITNVNTGSGYTCLFIKPYCDSFTLTSGANLTIGVSNLAGSLIMDSTYGNEVIVYNI